MGPYDLLDFRTCGGVGRKKNIILPCKLSTAWMIYKVEGKTSSTIWQQKSYMNNLLFSPVCVNVTMVTVTGVTL